jgi:hypothetical protein
VLDIPSEYNKPIGTPFERFSYYFKPYFEYDKSDSVFMFWEGLESYELKDLKYFETKLLKGENTIRVEYIAKVWIDISNWVKEYSFRYSLSPAKYWKSFGSLEITIEASSLDSKITTNLGKPTNGRLDSVAFWKFKKLPGDFFQITFIPKVSWFARFMIVLGPYGMTCIFAFILGWLHFLKVKKFRKNNLTKKYSWVLITGSIINPFLILVASMFAYDLIDFIIGSEAGGHHGYVFLVILLYPILLLIYWFTMWIIDRKLKRKINNAL